MAFVCFVFKAEVFAFPLQNYDSNCARVVRFHRCELDRFLSEENRPAEGTRERTDRLQAHLVLRPPRRSPTRL